MKEKTMGIRPEMEMELSQLGRIYPKEVIDLLRTDWESGLTKDETDIYLKPYFEPWKMKVISECIHKNYDEALLHLISGKSQTKKMVEATLLLYEDGVPIAEIETVAAKARSEKRILQYYKMYKEKSNIKEIRETNKPEPERNLNLCTESNEKEIDEPKKTKEQEQICDARNKLIMNQEEKTFIMIVVIMYCFTTVLNDVIRNSEDMEMKYLIQLLEVRAEFYQYLCREKHRLAEWL